MKAVFDSGWVTFIREMDDPKFYGTKFAKGEHALFRYIAKWLNTRGFAVIKKCAQKDGHMVGDGYQPYVRVKDRRRAFPHIYIISSKYAIQGANVDWNDGMVPLHLHTDIFETGQDTLAMINELSSKYPGLTVLRRNR